MVRMLLFGVLRERMGCHEAMIPVERGASVDAFLDAAEQRVPGLRRAMADCQAALAVNADLVADPGRDTVMVADGDEVALLPPFSGGSAGSPTDVFRHPGVRIQSDEFSLEAEVSRIKARSSRIGAVVAFTGTVRDCSHEREVLGIEVEVYPVMVMKRLEALRAEAVRTHALLAATIVVRQGRLDIGDDLILILAAAEHRHGAFLAARWCIDEIKRSVPIWKRELTTDGWRWVDHGC
ncbi:MAG: molybdenum cofactor biosynthesis protein MoaE [Nitrospirae bacterium]|nr:molybdenum cofactor biosynthesis protein MoaE [Nitrospirota bacterium]